MGHPAKARQLVIILWSKSTTQNTDELEAGRAARGLLATLHTPGVNQLCDRETERQTEQVMDKGIPWSQDPERHKAPYLFSMEGFIRHRNGAGHRPSYKKASFRPTKAWHQTCPKTLDPSVCLSAIAQERIFADSVCLLMKHKGFDRNIKLNNDNHMYIFKHTSAVKWSPRHLWVDEIWFYETRWNMMRQPSVERLPVPRTFNGFVNRSAGRQPLHLNLWHPALSNSLVFLTFTFIS